MSASERIVEIAGLRTTVVGDADAELAVLLLHGYAMTPADLAPFAHSLRLPALFLLPEGPLDAVGRGRAWWSVDTEARQASLAAGPRDLANEYPPGLPAARQRIDELLRSVATEFDAPRVVIGGFSQGGMLALDYTLRGSCRVDGLVLLSASRIALREWEPERHRLRDFPAFVSHGTADSDLAFAAGVALKEFVAASGAQLNWVPFEGGHEIPLVVWRALRKQLDALLRSAQFSTPSGNRAP